MENVSIIFASIEAENALDYLADRIELLHYAGNELFADDNTTTEIVARRYATEMLSKPLQQTSIPVGPEIDLSQLQDDKLAGIRDEYACMLKEIKAMFPLSDNEHVEANQLTYLSSAYGDYPANSLTLKQTTNLSVCYYVYPYIQVDVAQQQLVRNTPVTRPLAARSLSSSLSFGNLATKIAKAIAGKVGGGIGGLILNLLIPDEGTLTEDWEKINKSIETTVKRELVINNQEIALIKLKSYIKDFNTEYVTRKKNGQSTGDLFTYLERKDESLKNDVVALFMYKIPEEYEMEASTFGNFMLCANIHLAHLQEKALLRPNQSDKAVVSAWAREYYNYAKSAMDRIKTKRMNMISVVEPYNYTHCTVGKSQDCYRRQGFKFTDSYPPTTETKNEYGKNEEEAVKNRTQDQLNNYKAQKKAALESNFETNINPILENWRVLFDNPIPFKEPEFRW